MDSDAAPALNMGEMTPKPIHQPTVIPETELGEDFERPLVRRRQLSLTTDRSVWIICEKPVLMHIGYALDPESAERLEPFQISLSNTFMIEPEVELGEAFAKGWDKFPVELSVSILTSLLIPDGQTAWIDTGLTPAIDHTVWQISLTKATLFRHLRSG